MWLALGLCIFVTLLVWLKGFNARTYITKSASSFSGNSLLRTLQLSVLVVEKYLDGRPFKEFFRRQVSDDKAFLW